MGTGMVALTDEELGHLAQIDFDGRFHLTSRRSQAGDHIF